jgi:hypothetical protein
VQEILFQPSKKAVEILTAFFYNVTNSPLKIRMETEEKFISGNLWADN